MTPLVPGTERDARGDGRSHRRAASTNGDVAALVVGAALVLCMLSWFSWRMVQNVAKDRAAVAGQSSAPVHGH